MSDGLFPEPERQIPPDVIARMAPRDVDVLEWNGDQLQAFIEGMLIKREMQAVAYAMKRLAFVDPDRCQLLLDMLDLAHDLRATT